MDMTSETCGAFKQRRDPRHQVFAECGRRSEDMRKRGRELRDLRCDGGRERVFVHGIGHVDDARDAGDLRGLSRDR